MFVNRLLQSCDCIGLHDDIAFFFLSFPQLRSWSGNFSAPSFWDGVGVYGFWRGREYSYVFRSGVLE